MKTFHSLLGKYFHKAKVLWRWARETEYINMLHKYMTAKTPQDAGFTDQVTKDLRETIRGPIKFAMTVIAITIGFFVVWGGLAPLDSAAVAEGVIAVSGNHKTIQHLEGGIIESINVKEGQEVKEGDLLMTLSDSSAKAQKQIVESQLIFATATRARLDAEQNGYDMIIWDVDEFDQSNHEVVNIIKNQDNLFRYKREELKANQNIVADRIKQSQEEIIALEARLRSIESQKLSIEEEIKSNEKLMEKGLALKPRVRELQRHMDELIASVVEVKAKIAGANQAISENRLKSINIDNEYYKEISRETKENHSQVLDLTEKYNASVDVLNRTKIKSPSSGIVTDLAYHTVGGVVSPGHKIMDIVPQNEKLIVEAKVRTQDIDSIYPGMIAKIQLGAYKSRLVPRIEGKVIYVSPDKLVDQQSGMPYYLARIEIDESQIKSLTADIKLYPGMPATVFIVKGTRTFLQYIISPIIDSFYKAFKEV